MLTLPYRSQLRGVQCTPCNKARMQIAGGWTEAILCDGILVLGRTGFKTGLLNIRIVCLLGLVWCSGLNKRIAPLSFFHGCRKRRLKD
jgi:hypothetical protein